MVALKMALMLWASHVPCLSLTHSLQMKKMLWCVPYCSAINNTNKFKETVAPLNCREMLSSDSSLKKVPSLKELMQKRTYEA